MSVEKYLENNKVFTLSQWRKEGFTKKDIKRDDVVFYSTLLVSVKQENGKVVDRYEKIYIFDKGLAKLFKEIRRSERNNINHDEIAKNIKDMVADIFNNIEQHPQTNT